jgi:polysaccharide export outer membrane protein
VKCVANYRLQLGLALLVLTGSLLGQTQSVEPGGQGASNASGAVSQKQTDAKPAGRASDSSYVIGSDDLLSINVWKEPDLTRSTSVRTDGKISLPLIGEVQAAGRTPLQLEQDIAGKLKAFVTDPEVTVMVEQVNSKKFSILGQVAKPGNYSLVIAATVMDAIAAAGGFKDFAKTRDVYVLRQRSDGRQSRIAFNYKDFIKGKNPSQNVRLEPYDTVIVP